MLLGTRLTGFLVVHPFGRFHLPAALTPAILGRADLTGSPDKVVKCHHQCGSREPSPTQGCKVVGSHYWGVRPLPTDGEDRNGHLAWTDPDNDFTRIAADHDD